MQNLETESQALKENLLEMMDLVTSQLTRCRKALTKRNPEPAKEVIAAEKKVNALELIIDKDCENILALYNPVATDLRFVLASLKMGNDLERIGDNASALANFLSSDVSNKAKQYINKFKIEVMFDVTIEMLVAMSKAVREKDALLAMATMKKNAALNDHGKNAPKVAAALIKENPKDVKLIIRLFIIARRMERVGDLITNLGEEVVFHLEAKQMKHKKRKQKRKIRPEL